MPRLTLLLAAAATLAAPRLDRLRPLLGVRFVAGDDRAFEALARQAFDGLEQPVLVDADQRAGRARRARARRAADPVHVVLGHHRQFEIHDLRQFVDVDAARRDVGRDQRLQRAVLELGQRARARGLALVAVDRERRDAVLVQVFREAVGEMLGAREDQRLRPAPGLEQVHQQFLFAIAIDEHDLLRDLRRRRALAGDLDLDRVLQQARREFLDLGRKGRGEQQVLTRRRQHREHAPDVADEAHVEHAIRFVEHQHLDLRQIHGALLHVIQQTARCGDEDVDAALQSFDLRMDAYAAEYHE